MEELHREEDGNAHAELLVEDHGRLRDAHARGESFHDQRPGALASTRARAGGHGLQVLAVFTSGEDRHLQLLMLLTLAGARGAKCLS